MHVERQLHQPEVQGDPVQAVQQEQHHSDGGVHYL